MEGAAAAYIKHLIGGLDDRSGEILERLAEYLLSCMPGSRTQRRLRSASSDYDLVCSMEGMDLDFRSELGRYFVCECKDPAERIEFGDMSKFCRVLDSLKSRFGIMSAVKVLTRGWQREQLKVFQDRGMVIVATDRKDLDELAEGANLVSLSRTKYEEVGLDLPGD